MTHFVYTQTLYPLKQFRRQRSAFAGIKSDLFETFPKQKQNQTKLQRAHIRVFALSSKLNRKLSVISAHEIVHIRHCFV